MCVWDTSLKDGVKSIYIYICVCVWDTSWKDGVKSRYIYVFVRDTLRKPDYPQCFVFREQLFAVGTVFFRGQFPFQQVTREKAWYSVLFALSSPESRSPHSLRLHTRLSHSGIVCLLRKLLWKLALVERTKKSSCSVQKTYLRLLTIGLALARASAQLQDSNIPANRPGGGGRYSLPLRAVSSPRHSPLSSQPEWTCVAWLCVSVCVSQD